MSNRILRVSLATLHAALQTTLLLTLIMGMTGCSQVPLQEKNTTSAEQFARSSELQAMEARSKADPSNPELLYQLSLAYLAEDEKNKTQHYRPAVIQQLQRILTLVPGNPATLKLLYNIYYQDIVAGDDNAYDKAMSVFVQLPAASKRDLNAPSLGIFLRTFLAQKKSQDKNPQLLYRALLAAIKEHPENEKAYIQLARMYSDSDYFPLALATLKLGEEHINDSDALYQAIAITYEARAEASGCSYDHPTQLKKAIHYYQQAIPLAPERADLHYALARLFLDQNHYQLALHESALLVELEPTAENLAFHAQNYSILGFTQQANRFLAQAKQKGLNNSDPANHEIYMNAGDWKNAALSFTDYLQAKKTISVYDVAKADIIGQQADLEFSSLLRQKQLDFNSEWEAAIYAYWTGKMTPSQFGKTARNRCERTEYFFYSGYRDYRAGNLSAARQQFSAAIEQNTYRFIERPLAQYFLSSLGR